LEALSTRAAEPGFAGLMLVMLALAVLGAWLDLF
jgi:hypothetical protein